MIFNHQGGGGKSDTYTITNQLSSSFPEVIWPADAKAGERLLARVNGTMSYYYSCIITALGERNGLAIPMNRSSGQDAEGQYSQWWNNMPAEDIEIWSKEPT